MKWKSNAKRFLVMLLVLSMVAGLVPVNVFAASGEADRILPGYGSDSGLTSSEDLNILDNPELQDSDEIVDAAIIFTDLHTGASDYKQSVVEGVFGALKDTGLPFSSVTSAGDAFSVNEDETQYTGETATITGYIQTALGNDSIPVNYVWSDHDRYANGISKESGLIYGAGADNTYGTGDDGNYYIYALSMADTGTWDRYGSGYYTDEQVTEHIAAFQEAAGTLDKSKPLFIVAHQPLLDRRGDNGHAYEWALAINEVAKTMDVAYFFGHNHGYDETTDYYYGKGDTMSVATPEHAHGSVNGEAADLIAMDVVLEFPHICAGYMDPGSSETDYENTRQGTAIAVTIYDDVIRYTAIDQNGVYSSSENAALELNMGVNREHVSTTLKHEGVIVEAPGLIDLDVTMVNDNETILNAVSEYIRGDVLIYDIDVTGFENGSGIATITLPLPEGMDTPVVYRVSDDGTLVTKMNIEVKDGTITFPAAYIYNFVLAEDSRAENVLTEDVYAVSANDVTCNLAEGVTEIELSPVLLCNGHTATGVDVTWTYEVVGDTSGIIDHIDSDGTIHFAVTGNEGTCDVKVSATWTMDGETVTAWRLVYVNATMLVDYPEYPNEGSIHVDKTGTDTDFQASGIAKVELSAMGVPIGRGVDVILMLDMSTSMENHTGCGGKSCNGRNCSRVTRLDELKDALLTLEDTLKASPNSSNMRIAIADFNSFFGYNGRSSGTPYDRDRYDRVSGASTLSAGPRTGVVYNAITGRTCDIGAEAFVDVDQMNMALVDDALDNQGTSAGTNYDHAFDVIYQLGYAIQQDNREKGEERELVVMFMSDGAPNQYNYFHGINSANWNLWLQGTMSDDDLESERTGGLLRDATNKHYYDTNDHDLDGVVNEHRMASAIKGSPDEKFEVIRKSTSGLPTEAQTAVSGKDNTYMVPGLGATMFSVGFYLTDDGTVTAESARHVLEQIPTSTDLYIEASQEGALADAFSTIAHEITYAANNARYVDQVGDNYSLQLKPLVDLNGDALLDENDNVIQNKIEIYSYEVYTRADVNADPNDDITEDMIGERKLDANGLPIRHLLETVTFSEDGTEAYSDQIGGGTVNILADGSDPEFAKDVIYARHFVYNNSPVPVAIDGVNIPTDVKNGNTSGSTNLLPSETFYWKISTIHDAEMAMTYYVYLDGSMEGTREAGTYATNEYANLYYDNYLGNPCVKETVSPVMPWKEARISYAFYLVNEDGEILVNQNTGETGSFVNRIAVTNPVVYRTVLLNSEEGIETSVVADGILPDGYRLFDPSAQYNIKISSVNANSFWDITVGEGLPATTHVMGYDHNNSTAHTNATYVHDDTYDYSHTVVWFAVVWDCQALPDTVVIDYGLPVDISVLSNDMFGDYGELAGVGPYSEGLNLDGYDGSLADGFGLLYTGTYGTAEAVPEIKKVCYTLKNTDGQTGTMVMDGYEKFAYAVAYTGTQGEPGYYYDTVTVIPATSIYFEDNFLTYSSYSRADASTTTWEETTSQWTIVGTKDTADMVDSSYYPHQAEDRPGEYALADANNIYGYDGVNDHMTTYSLGSARKVTVDTLNRAEAEFTFWGTGFDVISMTSSQTGNVKVAVEKYNDETEAWDWFDGYTVDTYYGYKQADCHVSYVWTKVGDGYKWVRKAVLHAAEGCNDCEPVAQLPEDGQSGRVVVMTENDWVVNSGADGSIYQVPIIKMVDKDYGHYRVKIMATYNERFDHVEGSDSYDFYLDAIRIYDPANDGAVDDSADTTIEDAYAADHEREPEYHELRNLLIEAGSFGDDLDAQIEGLVFIDGDDRVGSAQLADYAGYGPNNEVYIAPGQRVAFLLDQPENVDKIHLGIKAANGKQSTYTLANIVPSGGEHAGEYYNASTYSIDSDTDMYYDLTDWRNDIIVISNTGDRYNTDGVISITNIKITYKAETADAQTAAEQDAPSVYMTQANAVLTVDTLNKLGQQEAEASKIFEPDLFHVKLNKNQVTVGQKVLVQVTTSADVEYVVINGVKLSTYTVGTSGNRSWKLMVEARKTGDMPIRVACFSETDVTSEAITQIVKVESRGVMDWLGDLIN